MNIVRKMCNPPQLFQLLIQFIEIWYGRSFTDTLEDFLHGPCQPCVNFQNIWYFSGYPFLPVRFRIHIFQLMIQMIVFRESIIILYRLRDVPILHQ